MSTKKDPVEALLKKGPKRKKKEPTEVGEELVAQLSRSDVEFVQKCGLEVFRLDKLHQKRKEDLMNLPGVRELIDEIDRLDTERMKMQAELTALVSSLPDVTEVVAHAGKKLRYSAPRVTLRPLRVSSADLEPYLDLTVDGMPAVRLQFDLDVLEEAERKGIIRVEDLEEAGLIERKTIRRGYVYLTSGA